MMNMNKVEELIAASKLGELMHKKEEEEKKKSCAYIVAGIVIAVVVLGVAAYALYKCFSPKYMEEFDDEDFEDFEDDFFEDDIVQ